MINKMQCSYAPLSEFISEYTERNVSNNFPPVAVGKYGIRSRESIYSKELAKDYSKNKLIYKDTLTVGMGSGQIDIGILTDDVTYSVSPAYHTYKISGVESSYLRYFLEQRNRDMFSRFAKRGCRQGKTIDFKKWLSYEIPVYDNDVQEQIVYNLNLVRQLISAREQQLIELNQLIKSHFIEMFGDPFFNDKHWEISKLGEYITLLTDFSANGSYKLLDSNVVMFDEPNYAIMVRTTDLESGDFAKGVKYIDQNAYELLSKSKLYGGELIMNKIGSAGRVYIMPHLDRPASLGRNAFMFRFDERINMTYLYTLLTSDYGTKEIQQYVRGAVTKTITKDSARAIRIMVPPISLQNQFAVFVEQVARSKSIVQKALEEARTLFDSLMQEYFG